MKRLLKFGSLAAFSILLASGSALAGDYDSGILSKTPSSGMTNVEFGSGWYLRGDLGYNFGQSLGVSFNRTTASGDANGSGSDSYALGVGFGYKFNEFVRSDITLDTFSRRAWTGNSAGCGADGLGTPYTGDCTSSDTGEFQALGLGLNGYFNLGRIGRFSPYVGAGVGVAHVEYTASASALTCVLDPGETCDLGVHSGGATAETFTDAQSFENGDMVSLTYALMAGFDYRIDKNWSADVGYRYTNITGSEVVSDTASTDSLEFDGVEIHEVRGGLRYEIW